MAGLLSQNCHHDNCSRNYYYSDCLGNRQDSENRFPPEIAAEYLYKGTDDSIKHNIQPEKLAVVFLACAEKPENNKYNQIACCLIKLGWMKRDADRRQCVRVCECYGPGKITGLAITASNGKTAQPAEKLT